VGIVNDAHVCKISARQQLLVVVGSFDELAALERGAGAD
jgi:hypothetical protein